MKKKKIHILLVFFKYMFMMVRKNQKSPESPIPHFLDSEKHSATYFLTISPTFPQLLKLILWTPWK